MPSKSSKQHKLMVAVANNPKFAKQVGIPQSVGQDFEKADKGRRFGMGGSPTITRGGQGMVNKQETRRGSTLGYQKAMPDINMNKLIGKKEGGKVAKHDDEAQDKKLISKMIKASEKKEGKGMACGGKAKKMSDGGMAERGKKRPPGFPEPDDVARSPDAMKKGGKVKKMASGGLAAGHKTADGIATKGKTRGMQVAMKKGGKC